MSCKSAGLSKFGHDVVIFLAGKADRYVFLRGEFVPVPTPNPESAARIEAAKLESISSVSAPWSVRRAKFKCV